MTENNWIIPRSASFESYNKIVGAYFQKQADSQPVDVNTIANLIGLESGTISYTVRFLITIGVLEKINKGEHKLTIDGTEYAKAVYGDDVENITKLWTNLVNSSHLKSLLDFIEFNKKNLTLDGLYKHVRTQGRFPVGDGPTGMTSPYATGSKTLFQLFKIAKMLPDDFIIDVKNTEKSTSKRTASKSTKSVSKSSKSPSPKSNPDPPKNDHASSDWITLSLNEFTMSLKKNIDQDTFSFIKSQIESNLQFWESKFVKKSSDAGN